MGMFLTPMLGKSTANKLHEACQGRPSLACTMLGRIHMDFVQESFLSLSQAGFHRIAYLDWGKHSAAQVVVNDASANEP